MKNRMHRDEAMDQLIQAAHHLGWQIAIPDGDQVEGLVIGTEEFLANVIGDDYEIWEIQDENDAGDMH